MEKALFKDIDGHTEELRNIFYKHLRGEDTFRRFFIDKKPFTVIYRPKTFNIHI